MCVLGKTQENKFQIMQKYTIGKKKLTHQSLHVQIIVDSIQI
jgi:hypothetical protein